MTFPRTHPATLSFRYSAILSVLDFDVFNQTRCGKRQDREPDDGEGPKTPVPPSRPGHGSVSFAAAASPLSGKGPFLYVQPACMPVDAGSSSPEKEDTV